MQFLLMSEEEIPTRKTTCAVWAFKGLLFCVRPFMALQMFKPRKGTATGSADMRSWLVRFRGRSICIR